MRIREYRSDDCAAMERLFGDTVRTVNAADYRAEQLEAWAGGLIDREAWNIRFLRTHTLVAVGSDETVEPDGTLRPDHAVIGFGNIDASGYLDMLYVHRGHQREGVGSALCDALEAFAFSQGAPCVETHASLTARPFFEQRGYVAVCEQQVIRHGVALPNVVMRRAFASRL